MSLRLCLNVLVGAKPLSEPTLGYINWTLRNKLQWIFYRYSIIFIQENAFENVVCEMASILSRPQCVKCMNLASIGMPLAGHFVISWSTLLKRGGKLLALHMFCLRLCCCSMYHLITVMNKWIAFKNESAWWNVYHWWCNIQKKLPGNLIINFKICFLYILCFILIAKWVRTIYYFLKYKMILIQLRDQETITLFRTCCWYYGPQFS